MPKVSIIVPNFNHAKYLPQRLDSILNQTFQDFEVILLDDCSTDNSIDILDQYRNHPKVSQLIVNEKNSGSPFKQWAKGINLAVGEYIWIAESDDWCEPTLLETLISALNRSATITLGFVQSYYITSENCIKWISKQDELEKIIQGNDFIKQYMIKGNAVFNASMAVFRKNTYYQLKPEFKNFKFCGDWLFWIGIAAQGDVFISGKVLNYFRNHSADVSGKAFASGLNYVEELQILFNLTDNKIISETDFLNALMAKHINYKLSRYTFSTKMALKIESLFYFDQHTKLFRNQLKINFIKMILKKSIKTVVKKIFLWK